MKNPNGYGSVVKLSGNRRRPYMARKTKELDERGYPVYKVIGYFAKREDALMALAEYNRDPYDIDASKITMAELYEKWSKRSFPKMSNSSVGSMRSSFKHCKNVHGMRYRDIKAYHMQDTIDNCGLSYSVQGAIKSLWTHLDKFALEMDIVNKGYAQLTSAASIPPTSKLPFTDEEVAALWQAKDNPWVDSVLIFLYTGWRISELLGLKREDVDLEAGTMTGGLKTKAGRGRIVPIHSRIFDMVKRRYDEGGGYLLSFNGKSVYKTQYYSFWNTIMQAHGMSHTPHEARHTFRSRLDSAGANKVAINKMMGHSGSDTGERIYTHKTLAELKEAIELIQN